LLHIQLRHPSGHRSTKKFILDWLRHCSQTVSITAKPFRETFYQQFPVNAILVVHATDALNVCQVSLQTILALCIAFDINAICRNDT